EDGEALAQLIAGPVQEALGRLGTHRHAGRYLIVGAVLELVQLDGSALPARQARHRRSHHLGDLRSLDRPRWLLAAVAQQTLWQSAVVGPVQHLQRNARMPAPRTDRVASDVLRDVEQ